MEIIKDYYKILDLNKTATINDIKKQYRKLAKIYHPDINPKTIDKFKEITEAYEILSNEFKRSDYNLTYHDKSNNTNSNESQKRSYNQTGKTYYYNINSRYSMNEIVEILNKSVVENPMEKEIFSQIIQYLKDENLLDDQKLTNEKFKDILYKIEKSELLDIVIYESETSYNNDDITEWFYKNTPNVGGISFLLRNQVFWRDRVNSFFEKIKLKLEKI